MFFGRRKGKPLLEVRRLKYGYGESLILKGVELKVRRGRIIAIVGWSGSGKSTLLRILAGELKKAEGVVKRRRRFLLPLSIGHVPQELALLPNLTLRENIIIFGNIYGLGCREAEKRGEKFAGMLKMMELMNRRIKDMSGGQKVRSNIICSILHDPPIILADEPFTGLDFNNRLLLWKFFIKMRKRGKGIVITTHNLNEAEKFCDEICVLHRGRIVVKGAPNRVRQKLGGGLWMDVKVKGGVRKIRDEFEKFCKERGIALVEYDSSRIGMMMKDMKDRKKVEEFLKKRGIEFEIMDVRVPTLDEIFLKVGL